MANHELHRDTRSISIYHGHCDPYSAYDVYWSSIKHSGPSMVFPFLMRTKDKTQLSWLDRLRGTNIASLIHVSPMSLERMEAYDDEAYEDLTRVSLPGDNQIWTVGDKIIKLVTSKCLWEHEINIYRLGLPCMPTMIDSWSNEEQGEYFIVFNRCGQSLQELYTVACLIPDEVKLL